MRAVFKRLSILLALGAAVFVTACDPVVLPTVEAVSLMGTEKTLVDHAVSFGSGKNCSTIRKERGLTYCVEDMPQVRHNIYCYRDLGGVTCYDKPAPNGSQQQRVDRNEHNLAK